MNLYPDKERKIIIGKRIQVWRKQRKFTQERFASMIERSTDAVSMIERGVNFPSRETLEKMSQVLNIPIKEFLALDCKTSAMSAREQIISSIIGLLHNLDDKSLKMALRHIEVLDES